MLLTINFLDRSSMAVNLDDRFEFNEKDKLTKGNRKKTNVVALVEDLNNGRAGIHNFTLMSHTGRVIMHEKYGFMPKEKAYFLIKTKEDNAKLKKAKNAWKAKQELIN